MVCISSSSKPPLTQSVSVLSAVCLHHFCSLPMGRSWETLQSGGEFIQTAFIHSGVLESNSLVPELSPAGKVLPHRQALHAAMADIKFHDCIFI